MYAGRHPIHVTKGSMLGLRVAVTSETVSLSMKIVVGGHV